MLEAGQVVAQLVDEVGLDRVLDDRVADLFDLGDVLSDQRDVHGSTLARAPATDGARYGRRGMSRTDRHPPIPAARTDITDEWMSQALGVDVAIVEEQRVGTGQVGMCVRYRLEGSEDAPARVVAKLPSDDDVSRATGMAMRNYEREVRFYNEIAPTVGIRTPRCYHADWDQASGLFVLLLEDLAPAQQGDQIEGCTLEEAALALDELAKLHAPRWRTRRSRTSRGSPTATRRASG